jgi:damage-control phosphatase, subfamily III
MSTFRSSRPAVLELAARYHELITQMGKKDFKKEEEADEAEKILFMEMCEICLWGNATDLSLLTSLTYEDIQKLQGSEARKASEKNIIVNDLEAAYDVLKKAKIEGKKERRVDIVLDNAGFELYVDLILAGFLLSAGLATNVILHPKSIPWFVSDVLPGDFAALLNALASPQAFYSTPSEDEIRAGTTPEPLKQQEIDELSFLFQEWGNFHAEGQLMLRPNRFWTEGGSFWRLPTSDPRLHEDLKQSELVIFKGDLNYRKLTGDVSIPNSLLRHSNSHRRCGIRPHHSRRPSALLVLVPASMFLHYEHAKLMLSLVSSLDWTKNSELWKEAVVILERANGRGMGNGPSCPSPQENKTK